MKNERFNIPMLISIRYASGEKEVINFDRVDRIQFRSSGATVRMHNYIIAEIVEFVSIDENPYAWSNQLCADLNTAIRKVMDQKKAVG